VAVGFDDGLLSVANGSRLWGLSPPVGEILWVPSVMFFAADTNVGVAMETTDDALLADLTDGVE